jgi:hypothetical protein
MCITYYDFTCTLSAYCLKIILSEGVRVCDPFSPACYCSHNKDRRALLQMDSVATSKVPTNDNWDRYSTPG